MDYSSLARNGGKEDKTALGRVGTKKRDESTMCVPCGVNTTQALASSHSLDEAQRTSLTVQQRVKIAENRQAALVRRHDRRSLWLKNVPIRHIGADNNMLSQAEDQPPPPPLLHTTLATTSIRQRFCFGRTTAAAARTATAAAAVTGHQPG